MKMLICFMQLLFVSIACVAQEVNYKNLIAEATQGDARSQSLLGYIYYFGGLNVSQDYSKAVYWFQKCEDQGKAEASAQTLLGECYYHGKGVKQDLKMAYELFVKASKNGNTYGKALLGEMFYKGDYVSKDYNKAFELFHVAATDKNTPNAHAMRMLSACYRYGLGTTIDTEKGKYWLEEAAKHKDDKAMMVAGMK